jgi:hypothetical protein
MVIISPKEIEKVSALDVGDKTGFVVNESEFIQDIKEELSKY